MILIIIVYGYRDCETFRSKNKTGAILQCKGKSLSQKTKISNEHLITRYKQIPKKTLKKIKQTSKPQTLNQNLGIISVRPRSWQIVSSRTLKCPLEEFFQRVHGVYRNLAISGTRGACIRRLYPHMDRSIICRASRNDPRVFLLGFTNGAENLLSSGGEVLTNKKKFGFRLTGSVKNAILITPSAESGDNFRTIRFSIVWFGAQSVSD